MANESKAVEGCGRNSARYAWGNGSRTARQLATAFTNGSASNSSALIAWLHERFAPRACVDDDDDHAAVMLRTGQEAVAGDDGLCTGKYSAD